MTFSITFANGDNVGGNLAQGCSRAHRLGTGGLDQSAHLFPAVIHELDEGQRMGQGRFVEQHDR
jgi:hypothetical protein